MVLGVLLDLALILGAQVMAVAWNAFNKLGSYASYLFPPRSGRKGRFTD